MSNDNDNTGDGSPQAPPPAPQAETTPSVKTFTQEEVNAIVAKRVEKERTKHARQEEGANPGAPAIDQAVIEGILREALAPITQKVESIEQRSAEAQKAAAFEKAVSGFELRAEDREFLRASFDPGNPGATSTYAKRLADTAAPANIEKGFNEPGNGVAPRMGELPADPRDFTKDDVARLQSEGRLREVLEKAHGVGQGQVFRAKRFGSK